MEPHENDFERWWYEVGSGITPMKGEDRETHAHRVAEAAFEAGLRANS